MALRASVRGSAVAQTLPDKAPVCLTTLGEGKWWRGASPAGTGLSEDRWGYPRRGVAQCLPFQSRQPLELKRRWTRMDANGGLYLRPWWPRHSWSRQETLRGCSSAYFAIEN